MRILHIRCRNLNSLVGEWAVDLTHPAYTADGLFAITGPTGAGKSTLLDAVCLALYGATPRLGRITQGSNEIMSRQCGDCLAEVTFETRHGRFRCTWSQHRARRRPDGALQLPRHEIAAADSGQVLEHHLRAVPERVCAVTGMDFERFTRAMLLAQGGFAAFLQAEPDQRAPLLEQLTGTALYSRLSQLVHERRGAEQQALDALQQELDGLALLPPEELAALRAQQRELQKEAAARQEELETTRAAHLALQAVAETRAALTALAEAQAGLARREADFAPRRARLAAALRALELAGDHRHLLALRQDQARDRQALEKLEADLPERQRALAEAERARAAAEDELRAAQTALREAGPLLQEVRALDTRLAERRRALQAAREAVAARCDERDALARALAEERDKLAATQKAHDDLAAQQTAHAADERLVTELTGLRERLQQLAALERQRQVDEAALAEAERALAGAGQAVSAAEADQRREAEVVARARAELERARQAEQALRAGRNAAAWRDELEAARERQSRLETLARQQTARAELAEQQAALARQQTDVEAALARLAEQAGPLDTRATDLQARVTDLERLWRSEQRIVDLEAARHSLRDGEPCPLCGATEHPWAEAAPAPDPQATEARLASVRAELEQVRQERQALAVQRAARDSERQALAERLAEAARQAEALDTDIAATLRALALPAPPTDLAARQAEAAAQVRALTARLDEIEQTAQQVAAGREALAAAERALHAAEQALLTARRDHTAAEQARDRQRQSLAEGDKALARVREGLAAALQPWHGAPLADTDLDALAAELTARRDAWQARATRLQALATELGRLGEGIARQEEALQRAAAALAEAERTADAQAKQLAADEAARAERFGDRDPDREEERLQAAVTDAEARLARAREAVDAAQTALTEQQARRDALEQAITGREAELTAAEARFRAALAAAGFADEAAFEAARLPAEERERLAAEAEALASERERLTAREAELRKALATAEAAAPDDSDPTALKARLAELEERQGELQQRLGAIGERLAQQAAREQAQRALLARIEAQRREWARWNDLHALIGSADGKKYRNFAQGLTFELVIGHANEQLRRMSDRYLLVHDPTAPLTLNVIDQYQGGEIRSTRNLSGGESFLVSLALALGLSRMASRNVQVDSLFLDEGFGTLDEDALELALETLAGLQQEGKLIGVISHVPALKARITTQIEVVPQSGGRSLLRGPGCERLG